MFPARIAGFLLLWPFAAWAGTDDAALCEVAATRAAQVANMPVDVMRALTLVETGRSRGGAFRPWPWTINLEGKGYWFDTRAEAEAFARESLAAGARSFDVGCFQINYRWHGQAFASVEQMFGPQENAAYAARFMGKLFAEGGTWEWAAGAYHSRRETLAAGYRARFTRILAGLGSVPDNLPAIVAENTGTVAADPSTWDPFARSNGPVVLARNGSLADRPVSGGGGSLLTRATGALF